MSPNPMTQDTSPSRASDWRKACNAMAPTVVNAASAASTLSGTGTHRFVGTQLYSAWWAYWLPPQATRCPTSNGAPSPTSVTMPETE